MIKVHLPGPGERPAFDLEPPNKGLVGRGGLAQLCLPGDADRKGVPPWAFHAGPGEEAWMDAKGFEEALLADPAVVRAARAALAAVDTRGATKAAGALVVEADRVFEEVVLADIIRRYAALAPLVARYLMAVVASTPPSAAPPRKKEKAP